MGDYDPYVQALLAEASNNSYNTFGGIASSLSGEAAKAALQPEQDLGEALLYSSVLGLLGGGLSQYGKQSALDDYNAVAPLLYGKTDVIPDGQSSLGRQALSYRNLIENNESRRLLQKVRDANLDIGKQDIIGDTNAERDLEFMSKKAAKEEEIAQALSDGTLMAGDAKDSDVEAPGIRSEAEPALKPGILTRMGQEQYKILNEVNKQIEGLDSVQQTKKIRTALANLKDVAVEDSGTSDIQFATLFIQGLDGSVVREGEYARVQGANPTLAAFRNELEGALTGASKLGPEIKMQMWNEMRKRGDTVSQLALEDTEKIRGNIKDNFGIDASNTGTTIYKMPYESFVTAKTKVPEGMKKQQSASNPNVYRLIPIE